MLLLVDGRRLNDVDLTDPPAVPLASIERIEIIHGGWRGAVWRWRGGRQHQHHHPEAQAPGTGDDSRSRPAATNPARQCGFQHNEGPFSLRLHANSIDSDGYRDTTISSSATCWQTCAIATPTGTFPKTHR